MQSATVVGRRKEVETLRSAGAAAEAGRGSIVFLSGRRGSGKSSLLAQTFASAADSSRRATVAAHCYESSLGNPLGPFKEVLKILTARNLSGQDS